MDPNYSRQYRELYERHWWWRAREETILEVLRRRFGSRSDLRILDVGCGDGLFFSRLEPFGEVEGVEPAGDLVDARGAHRTKINVGPFDESFQPGKHYSLILMLDVLEHLDRPETAIRHARSLLEPGGLLLVTVPAFPLLWTSHDILNEHRTRFTKATFRKLAEQAELRILDARYLFLWLFPAKLLIRGMEIVLRSRPAVPRVPAPWLNRALWKLSKAESRLALRISFPLGGSLLLLATPGSEAKTVA